MNPPAPTPPAGGTIKIKAPLPVGITDTPETRQKIADALHAANFEKPAPAADPAVEAANELFPPYSESGNPSWRGDQGDAVAIIRRHYAPLVAEVERLRAAKYVGPLSAHYEKLVAENAALKAERDERTDDAEVAMKFQKKAEAENAALRAQLKDASMRGMSVALEAYTRDLADIKAENAALKAQVERLEEAEKCSEIVVAQECEIIDEKDATITDLRAQVEQFTEIVKNVNGHRGRGDRRMVVPKDDAGRAAYWKARTKQAEAELDKACSSLLDEEAQLATAQAELAQERARLSETLVQNLHTVEAIWNASVESGVYMEQNYKDCFERIRTRTKEAIDAARKQEGKL